MGLRQVQSYAIDRPDLNDEVVGGITCRNRRLELIFDRLIAQQQRGLPQLVVEKSVCLPQRVSINDPPACSSDQHDSAEQPDEQTCAQGAHGAGLTR